jgi:hypothetical protein
MLFCLFFVYFGRDFLTSQRLPERPQSTLSAVFWNFFFFSPPQEIETQKFWL